MINEVNNIDFNERLKQFKVLFNKTVGENRTYSMFYTEIKVDPIYMGYLLKGKNHNFPNPKVLERIIEHSADKSITYEELYRVCGYALRELENPKDRQIKRCDILYVDLGEGVDSEQGGKRPCLVVGNLRECQYSPNLLIAPITSKVKASLATHVILGQDSGLEEGQSTVLLEQLRSISKNRIINYIGHVNDDDIKRINKAIEIATGTWTEEDALLESIENAQNNEVSIFKKAYTLCLGLFRSKELIYNNQ